MSFAAAGALLNHDELPVLVDKAEWLHERATRGRPVAGVQVDVLGPEAGGAVVRVTVACDPAVAVGATEVLAGAREAPRQKAPRFVEPNGARRRDPSAGSPSRARTSGRRSQYLLGVRVPVDLRGRNRSVAGESPSPNARSRRAPRCRSGAIRRVWSPSLCADVRCGAHASGTHSGSRLRSAVLNAGWRSLVMASAWICRIRSRQK
jgi:hypothetical protein